MSEDVNTGQEPDDADTIPPEPDAEAANWPNPPEWNDDVPQ